jgi:hypothetical protein
LYSTVIFDFETPEDHAYAAGVLWILMDLEASGMRGTIDPLDQPLTFAFMRTTATDRESNIIGTVPDELLTTALALLGESDSNELRL